MNLALYNFTPYANELPEFNLKLLLNIEDLNNAIFDEVFNTLRPQQQEQYIVFKNSEKAKIYREYRNAEFPYVDFNNLPEILDDALLQKIMLYKEDTVLRRVVHDLLSTEHKNQITRYESSEHYFKTQEEIKKVEDDNERKRNTRKFNGNMGEPDTVTSFILEYGVNPLTLKPETIKSFYEKYTIDPKTGDPVLKQKKE